MGRCAKREIVISHRKGSWGGKGDRDELPGRGRLDNAGNIKRLGHKAWEGKVVAHRERKGNHSKKEEKQELAARVVTGRSTPGAVLKI